MDKDNLRERTEADGITPTPSDPAKQDGATEEVLDLRAVERFQRHPLVFSKFDELPLEQSFVLINDHDPIPLHGQMDTLRPRQLTWEYITRGPDIFRIRVCRIAPLDGSEISPTAHTPSLEQIRPAR